MSDAQSKAAKIAAKVDRWVGDVALDVGRDLPTHTYNRFNTKVGELREAIASILDEPEAE